MIHTAQMIFRDGKLHEMTEKRIADTNSGMLILGFGSKQLLESNDLFNQLHKLYPKAEIVLCSTAGQIYNDMVYDYAVSLTVISFEKTRLKTFRTNISENADGFEAGKTLFRALNEDELSYLLVISDGRLVNGSQLVRGLESENVNDVPITGGLAGDGADFSYTLVGCNELPSQGEIVGIGFYGQKLKIGHGSFGGWELFGPEKQVTRSHSNQLFEVDNKNAVDIYKKYLGKYANELPGSALLFPLNVRTEGSHTSVVRTILSINQDEQSMVFAGDIPQGAHVRFMKGNFDKLVDAATQAAASAQSQLKITTQLALMVSCVGRKLILGRRTDEEIEAVRQVFGPDTGMTGFYSYGEICPQEVGGRTELHNQTMTITTLSEI